MRELIIVRHGSARERDPSRWSDDRDRPLTPEGRRKFRTAASGLGSWIPDVDLLLTSPLRRAKQTASILTKVAGWPKATECAELEPDADPAPILARVQKAKVPRVALVGHEPHLSRLISLCISDDDSTTQLEFKTGSVALIEFPRSVRARCGTLTALLPPRVMRRMR
jgi:phosphohistidine phosphatase